MRSYGASRNRRRGEARVRNHDTGMHHVSATAWIRSNPSAVYTLTPSSPRASPRLSLLNSLTPSAIVIHLCPSSALGRAGAGIQNQGVRTVCTKGAASGSGVAGCCRGNRTGLIHADLGGSVIKQRIARSGGGKSGGFRSIILYRTATRAVFVYGFEKRAGQHCV